MEPKLAVLRARNVTVSVVRNGTVIEAETIPHPDLEAVERAVRALIGEAARKCTGPIWPFQVEVK